jgi:hypothetical protein
MEQKRNRSLINGYWNDAGVQFIPAPWLQPTNQESQTSVIFRLKKKVTENSHDNFDWKSLLTLMAYGSEPVVDGSGTCKCF